MLGGNRPAAGDAARAGIEISLRPSDTATETDAQPQHSRWRRSPHRRSSRLVAFGQDSEVPLTLRLRRWRSLRRGALRGHADVVLLPIGLVVLGVTVFVSPRGTWASLPAKPALDGSVRQRRENGKAVFEAVAFWQSRRTGDAISQTVIALIRERDPASLLPDDSPPIAPPRRDQQASLPLDRTS
jgi:hypothetical protein